MTEIKVGSIVKYNDGFYRVTRLTKNTANLGSTFGKTIYFKGINRNELVEASDSFYEKWQKSESYQCM
jgi:hypothetical protein